MNKKLRQCLRACSRSRSRDVYRLIGAICGVANPRHSSSYDCGLCLASDPNQTQPPSRRDREQALRIFLAVFIVTAAASSQAQTIFKCGEDQKIYSDRPCVDGQVLPRTRGRPTDAQRAEAQEIADRERELARDLEKERLAQERAPKANALGMDTRMRVTRSAPESSHQKQKNKRLKFYTVPSSSKPHR